jgi:hypothetical protein
LAGYGITDAAAASGSTSYIQNGTAQQTSSNFNISGNGTIGGQLVVTGGTISTAAMTGTSDLGLYSLSNGSWLRMVTNQAPIKFFSDANVSNIGSTPNFTIESNGNVGVGVPNAATPQAKFDVRGGAIIGELSSGGYYNSNAVLHLRKTDAPHLILEDAGNNTAALSTDGNGLYMGTESTRNIYFKTGFTNSGSLMSTGTTQMFIDGTNNRVGIGTTSPGATLNVIHPTANTTPTKPTGNWAAIIENNQDGNDSRNGLSVATRWGGSESKIFEVASYWSGSAQSYTPALTVLGNRNVGIGVSSPSYVLDVADRIQLRSGTSGTAGVWFQNSTNSGVIGFFGTADDNTVGLYGVGLNNWGLNMNRTSGNVGIGTTSPGARLNVVGKSLFSRDNQTECCGSNETIAIAESSNSTGRQASISFHNGGEAEAFIRLAGGGSGARSGQRRLVIGDNQSQATTLQIQGLVGTGNRPVFADANGLLKIESIVNKGSEIATTAYGSGAISNAISTSAMTVVSGDVIDIEGWLRVQWNGGTGNDEILVTTRFVSGTGGCTNGDIGVVLLNASRNTTGADGYFKTTWTANCSGTVVFSVTSIARNNADDNFRYVNPSRLRAIKR